MKRLSILLLSSISVMTANGFRHSTSSDLVWPKMEPSLKERTSFVFNEADFDQSLETTITLTLLVKKNGEIEEVIPAMSKVNPFVLKEISERVKTWRFNPNEKDHAVVLSFRVKIETD